jgi:hypothetical protein
LQQLFLFAGLFSQPSVVFFLTQKYGHQNGEYHYHVYPPKQSHLVQSPLIESPNVQIYIDDQLVDNNNILEFDEIKDGQNCHRWVTMISGWQPNTTTKLESSYLLSETIFDGTSYSQAGEYHFIIFVTVQ